MANQWFFPAQEKLSEFLEERFTEYSCEFQTVTHDRVFEGYLAAHKETGIWINLMVVIIRGMRNKSSLFIYETNQLLAKHINA